MTTPQPANSMLRDIWASYRSQPLWVQVWVAAILMPVNMISLFFLHEPMGIWIAVLAVGAMLPNLAIMLHERGFSRTMAVPHVGPWLVLVGWLIFARPPAAGLYGAYLWVLLAIDGISLLFDIPESAAWFRERRRKRATSEHTR